MGPLLTFAVHPAFLRPTQLTPTYLSQTHATHQLNSYQLISSQLNSLYVPLRLPRSHSLTHSPALCHSPGFSDFYQGIASHCELTTADRPQLTTAHQQNLLPAKNVLLLSTPKEWEVLSGGRLASSPCVSLTHSLTPSLTHSLTHSVAPSLRRSLTHSLTPSLTHPLMTIYLHPLFASPRIIRFHSSSFRFCLDL